MNSIEGDYFNTHICIMADCGDEILASALTECDSYERLLSRTIPGSDVWNINHLEPGTFELSNHTKVILDLAEAFRKETDGLYNVSWAGPVDLGSIAKGYIADRLGDMLRARGVCSALINLGGNVLTIGSTPDETPWKIGLQYPTLDKTLRDKCFGFVKSEDNSVVTSGVYERGRYVNGVWHHHIIDPRTGDSVSNDVLSVTVVSQSSVMADVLSTALLIVGPERGIEMAEKYNAGALFYMKGDRVLRTSSFDLQM